MLLLPINREQLLLFLPKGGNVAEIGVAQGEFSRFILQNTAPNRLHLIDPWEHQEREDYQEDLNNVSAGEQQQRFENVSTLFAQETASGKITIHRMYSQDAVSRFSDGYFDWIYIDGLHSYEGVRRDLLSFQAKVKPDGFILGHDYTLHGGARRAGFGVVQAVDEFVKEQGWHFIGLTIENWPTYLLAHSAEAERTKVLIMKLLYNVPKLVELRDYPTGRFDHKLVPFDKRVAAVMSF